MTHDGSADVSPRRAAPGTSRTSPAPPRSAEAHGWLVNPLPADVLRRKGADVVIAVDPNVADERKPRPHTGHRRRLVEAPAQPADADRSDGDGAGANAGDG